MSNKRIKLNLDSKWINTTLSELSLEQKIGQLLHPFIRSNLGVDAAKAWLDGIEVGGAFFFPEQKLKLQNLSKMLQESHAVPVIISSDLENGAGRMINGAVIFPDNMAVAATANPAHAYLMGEAAAKEGRECGVHWSFGPVVDINQNHNNPITNTRSFGDNQQLIKAMANQMVQGMQKNGMAACAKHFPGDGFDDRDHHLCTTINPLSYNEWKKTSGALFQDMIDEGVWTIMIGHIALPSVDPGKSGKLIDAAPAVLSYKLTTELLREEMGFEGLIISDAIGMGGSCSHYPESEVVVRSIEAGCDMVLFAQPRTAFNAIQEAVQTGRLSHERIELSVRRILALKEQMNLHTEERIIKCSTHDRDRFEEESVEIAEAALTLVTNKLEPDALPLKTGMKVLSLHVRGDALYNVDAIDTMLAERGIEVVRAIESDNFEKKEWYEISSEYDALLIHAVFGPSWATNRIRLSGNFNRAISHIMKAYNPRTLFTSFGSPYHIYEFPRAPFYMNAYSPDIATQKAYVKFLFGELKPQGISPVNLQKLLGPL